MIRLQKLAAIQRKIRQDDIADLGIPDWTLVSDAIKAGKTEQALEYLEYASDRAKFMHDSLIAWCDDAMTQLTSISEEEIPKLLRRRYTERVKKWIAETPGVEETMQIMIEYQRSHVSNLKLVEEPDRYVLTCDPCGSGGRLMRTKKVATTKKPHPWSWSKAGIAYYCTHCCVAWEQIATEIRGYPLRIALAPEKPSDPCIHLYYKKPELIPEEYFTRIGMKKTIKKAK